MEKVDTKQLDEQIQDLEHDIKLMNNQIKEIKDQIIIHRCKIINLKERKKSIELYNKK